MEEASSWEGAILVEIMAEGLDLGRYVAAVADDAAGAVATFLGVTRNNFDGRAVVKLEYEAYEPMALKKMRSICEEVHRRWQPCKVAIGHRIGTVLVGEASVAIAVSSPHRKEALEATQWAIDELKATVPIWKKEFFQDGSVWKENREAQQLRSHDPLPWQENVEDLQRRS